MTERKDKKATGGEKHPHHYLGDIKFDRGTTHTSTDEADALMGASAPPPMRPGDVYHVNYHITKPDRNIAVVTEEGVTIRATKPFDVKHRVVHEDKDTTLIVRIDNGENIRADELMKGKDHKGNDYVSMALMDEGKYLYPEKAGMFSKHVTNIHIGKESAARFDGSLPMEFDGQKRYNPRIAAAMEGRALKALGVVAEKDGKPVEAPLLTGQDLVRLAQKNLESKVR